MDNIHFYIIYRTYLFIPKLRTRDKIKKSVNHHNHLLICSFIVVEAVSNFCIPNDVSGLLRHMKYKFCTVMTLMTIRKQFYAGTEILQTLARFKEIVQMNSLWNSLYRLARINSVNTVSQKDARISVITHNFGRCINLRNPLISRFSKKTARIHTSVLLYRFQPRHNLNYCVATPPREIQKFKITVKL